MLFLSDRLAHVIWALGGVSFAIFADMEWQERGSSASSAKCVFCAGQRKTSDAPIQICECSVAHELCFLYYQLETGRRTCVQCRQPWSCAESYTNAVSGRWRHVRIRSGFVMAADLTISLFIFLALVIVYAYVVKGLVYALFGSPNYAPFGLDALAVRIEPGIGDFVVGSLALLLFVIVKRGVPLCARCCAARRDRSLTSEQYASHRSQEADNEAEMEQMVPRSRHPRHALMTPRGVDLEELSGSEAGNPFEEEEGGGSPTDVIIDDKD